MSKTDHGEKEATGEGSVGGDRDGGDAHDDVGHGHVGQVEPGVDPELLGSGKNGQIISV